MSRYRPDLALSLDNLGASLSQMGRPADGVPVTEEAIALYRKLVQVHPAHYRPALATSLSNLGLTLTELGRAADALPVTEEAVALYRELVQANPVRYHPGIATSLTNLSFSLSSWAAMPKPSMPNKKLSLSTGSSPRSSPTATAPP